MSLRQHLAEYLATRRRLGVKLARDGKLLPGFLDHLEASGGRHVTSRVAVAWATEPTDVHPAWWTSRLSMVRGFARYLQAIDPRHEVPPIELLPHRRPRTAPYIFASTEIDALLGATATLMSPLRTATYRTLLGLLAVTGVRVSEAIALDDADFDRRRGVLRIRRSKFGKTREIPLHRTTTRALVQYADERDRLARRRRTRSFFVSIALTRLIYNNVHETFLRLVYAAGLADREPRRPRIHDLRHTFAVRTVLRWHRAGDDDVEAKLPTLSTYLGHIGPSTTYWYLTAVPELLDAATARFERFERTRP